MNYTQKEYEVKYKKRDTGIPLFVPVDYSYID